MRLQPKRQINTEVATQKKSLIDQGIALAGKVDALRETKLQEEQRLDRWRKESIAQIQSQIDLKIRESDSWELKIRDRKEELRILQKPLDEAWESIKSDRAFIERDRESVFLKKDRLDQSIVLVSQQIKENEDEKNRLQLVREQTTQALANAEDLKSDAVKELLKARADASKITSDAKERQEAVIVREHLIESRENVVEARDNKQNEREIEQNKRERRIQDLYKTFMRTSKRT